MEGHSSSFNRPEGSRSEDLGLEHRIRGMILDSDDSGQARDYSTPKLRGLSEVGAQDVHDRQSGGQTLFGRNPNDATRGKPLKRRLNQAQRRQLSSQLSIPVGPEQYQQQISDAAPNWNTRPHAIPYQAGQAAYHQQTRHAAPAAALSHGFHRPPFDGANFLNANRNLPQETAPYLYNPTGNSDQKLLVASEPAGVQGPSRTQFQYTRSRPIIRLDDAIHQADLLNKLCHEVVRESEIDRAEIAEKEEFRQKLETLCQMAIYEHEAKCKSESGFPISSVQLRCFGSLSSGFATKASDMDLGLFSPLSDAQPDTAESPIPRLLEKVFLEAGYGARLLSRTRVPIIKLCEHPPEHLRLALLAERSKWEEAGDTVNNDRLEEGPSGQQDQFEKTVYQDNPEAEDGMNEPLSPYEFEVPSPDGTDKSKRLHLRQGPRTSLTSYYSMAKRVLRKAGGRDVTWSNHRELRDLDWVILNRVSAAFVQGLCNPDLRMRIDSIPSLSFRKNDSSHFRRSLSGVYTQVDGEDMLLEWNQSLLPPHAKGPTQQDTQAVLGWEKVQKRTDFSADPLLYNKDIQISFDKLSALPRMKLMRLAQGQQESPNQYFSRIMHLRRALIGESRLRSMEATVPEIVSRYVSGVHGAELRSELQGFLDSSQVPVDLQDLLQKHRCLQLAEAFSKAMENEQYEEAVLNDIRKYVALLHSPLQKVQTQRHGFAAVVPLQDDNMALLSTVRRLPDPRTAITSRTLDKSNDKLEFPASGAGVQCDINFSAHLALQNSLLLRCYSLTDTRVRPFVLFIKRWAKVRGINSGYRGTLSSYGYVLMVLHYLVNVASPFVCPNLQQLAPTPPQDLGSNDGSPTPSVNGYSVQFWRNEAEILHLATTNQLNRNDETVGQLLWGFFEYFAHNGALSRGYGRGFDWGRDVLSLRSPGGILTKQAKGWTGARTVIEGENIPGRHRTLHDQQQDWVPEVAHAAEAAGHQPNREGRQATSTLGKEVRHRYLFAIEDPFEHDHNVARTVTHKGIVSIRDEFRRAWTIIRSSGSQGWQEALLENTTTDENELEPFGDLLNDIHGL